MGIFTEYYPTHTHTHLHQLQVQIGLLLVRNKFVQKEVGGEFLCKVSKEVK